MRGRTVTLDCRLRLSHVARRLPPGRGLDPGPDACGTRRHRPHVGPGRLRQHGPITGRAYPVGRGDGHVGSPGTRPPRAGVETLGAKGEPSQGSLRLAFVWGYAATDMASGA